MYYLQSRYYDPAICRFINADSYVSTGQGLVGYNMFAYCRNNSVIFVDFSGDKFTKVALGPNNHNLLNEQNTGGIVANQKYPSYVATDKAKILQYYENGQLYVFSYCENPDYNISTSFYYANVFYEIGLPDGRTYEGVCLELIAHYVVYKIDIFDITDRDNEADIGNYDIDNNAWFWEFVMHLLTNSLEGFC